MVFVKISPVGKLGSLARGLPVTVEVKADAKVSDVKAAIAAKFPRVGFLACHEYETESPP